MKRLTFLLFCLLLGIGMANAQTTKVTGTVISAEDNEPIIGASIVVKGTTIGTVTDFNESPGNWGKIQLKNLHGI